MKTTATQGTQVWTCYTPSLIRIGREM